MIGEPWIDGYIELVRSGAYPVCQEQVALVDYVDRVFSGEDIYVDSVLQKYKRLEKYMPFELFEWERFVFVLHNCVRRKDMRLRWPTALIYMGRGNGKNGYLSFENLCLSSPYNPIEEYYIDICANSEDQARTTYDDVYNILEDDKRVFSKFYKWNKEVITGLQTRSSIRFRTSNAKTKDGGRPGKVDFDEVHAYEDYKQIKVFRTGLGKKADARITYITTDGDVRGGPLDDLLTRAHDILSGSIPDNGLLPFLCRLDSDDEIRQPQMWYKANPSLQYLPNLLDELESEYADYLQNPLANADFATKRMNRPVGDRENDVTTWDNILRTNQPPPDLTGLPCVWGIDYAKTTDFVSAGLLFLAGGKLIWKTHTGVCRACIDLPRIKAPLDQWEQMGLLDFVDGPEIPPEVPIDWIFAEAAVNKYRIVHGAMDTYRYTWLATALQARGIDTSKGSKVFHLVRPSDIAMISPVLTSKFNAGELVWGDNPLMRWYTNNTKQSLTKKGNVDYGKKEPKSRKTDGFFAFLAAMTCLQYLQAAAKLKNQIKQIKPIIIR